MNPAQPETLFDDLPTVSQSRPEPKPLTGQILRVYDALKESSTWLTIPELQEQTGDPQNSISAQLRGLRSRGYSIVGRRREGANGLWEYWLAKDGPETERAA